jgi:hypothetical protein
MIVCPLCAAGPTKILKDGTLTFARCECGALDSWRKSVAGICWVFGTPACP